MTIALELLLEFIQGKLDTGFVIKIDPVHMITGDLSQGIFHKFFAWSWVVLFHLSYMVFHTGWIDGDSIRLVPMTKRTLELW